MITRDMAKVSKVSLSLVEGTAHTLIAGATGCGKSVLLNSILYSLIKKGVVYPDQFPYFVLIDTKRVELKQYKPLRDFIDYESEPEKVCALLDWVIKEMDRRFDEMKGKETTAPYIYVVVDELADLVEESGVLDRIVKIGRLGRAAHIHLLCCTQDPSRRTLSARLMQNFTTCVALKCKSDIDSRQVIGRAGAEDLPKHGKAIVLDQNGYRVVDTPYISDDDIDNLVEGLARCLYDEAETIEESKYFDEVLRNPAENIGEIW